MGKVNIRSGRVPKLGISKRAVDIVIMTVIVSCFVTKYV